MKVMHLETPQQDLAEKLDQQGGKDVCEGRRPDHDSAVVFAVYFPAFRWGKKRIRVRVVKNCSSIDDILPGMTAKMPCMLRKMKCIQMTKKTFPMLAVK